MNTLRRSALLWEQRSQKELIQTLKAVATLALSVFNIGLFLIWAAFKFLTNLFFWFLTDSRPVIRINEHRYQELHEVYPRAYTEPATQIQHLGRRA